MAPVKLGYTKGDGLVTDKHIEFYKLRSNHVGAIIPEPLYIHKGLRELPTQLGIDADDKIEGLKRLTDTIHAGGAKAIAHLNHPGRMANPKIPGNFWVSSTDKPCENGGATPKKMTKDEIKEAVEIWKNAAIRAEKAGFDYVELQFGHGYLVAQFLSPSVNDRDDEYGGSLENRMRFAFEVLDAVKSAVSIPIIARITSDEIVPGGITKDEAKIFAAELEKRGVAAIHAIAGSACNTPPWFFQHMFVPKGKIWELAAEIKKAVNIPVIFVGRIHNADDVKELKEKYGAEYFALGRALVADENVVGKLLGEVNEVIRPCLACAEGCLGGVKSGKGLQCVVNPTVGTGLSKAEKRFDGKVAVVGGGLAGMEAAIRLKERGAEVELYEKDKLGGQFNLAYLPPHKQSLKELVDYYQAEIKNKGIKIINKEVSADELSSGNYDKVIVATGSKPVVPPIKGLKEYYWTEFLNDDQLPENKKVVIVGGGLIGVEVAAKLLQKNNKVVIVEMLPDIANGMEMIERVMTLKLLKDKGVEIYTSSMVKEVDGDKIKVKGENGDFVIEGVDHIVMATGMKPENALYESIKDKVDAVIVGDAKKVGKAQSAIADAFETVSKI
jgi:2,4-dienoyl-CoA reductase-like NADH-dependent reductase (Old Yellow Enzyme family)/thioredoxin reductase